MANPIRISGLNSGLDTDAIVKAMTAATMLKITKQQRNVLKLNAKQEAYQAIIDKFNTLKTKYMDVLNRSTYLKSPTIFKNYKPTITNSSTGEAYTPKGVTITTQPNAQAGTYNVKVESKATQTTYTGNKINSNSSADVSGLESNAEYTMGIDITANGVVKNTSLKVETDSDGKISNLADINDQLKKAYGTSNNGENMVNASVSSEGKLEITHASLGNVTIKSPVKQQDATGLTFGAEGDFKTGKNSFDITIDGETKTISFQTVSSDYFDNVFKTVTGEDGTTTVEVADKEKYDLLQQIIKEQVGDAAYAEYTDKQGDGGSFQKITSDLKYEELADGEQKALFDDAYEKMHDGQLGTQSLNVINKFKSQIKYAWEDDIKAQLDAGTGEEYDKFQAEKAEWEADEKNDGKTFNEKSYINNRVSEKWASLYNQVTDKENNGDFKVAFDESGSSTDKDGNPIEGGGDDGASFLQVLKDNGVNFDYNSNRSSGVANPTNFEEDLKKYAASQHDNAIATEDDFLHGAYNEFNAYKEKYAEDNGYSATDKVDAIKEVKDEDGNITQEAQAAVPARTAYENMVNNKVEAAIADIKSAFESDSTAGADAAKAYADYYNQHNMINAVNATGTFKTGDKLVATVDDDGKYTISTKNETKVKDADGKDTDETKAASKFGIQANNGNVTEFDGITPANKNSVTISNSTKLKDLDGVTKDSSGNYTFTINGANFSFKEDATIKDVLTGISNNTTAKIDASFSTLDNTVTLKSKEYGTGTDIEITKDDSGLMAKLGLVSSSTSTADDGTTTTTVTMDTGTKTAGQNLAINVNGKNIEVQGNSYTLDGVTFAFDDKLQHSEDYKEEFTVEINEDKSLAKETVKEFVKDYNELISFVYGYLDEKVAKNTTKGASTYHFLAPQDIEDLGLSETQEKDWNIAAKKGILYRDSLVTSIMGNIRNAMYTGKSDNGDGTFFGLFDMGITTDSDYMKHGQLKIDEEKFDAAFEKYGDKIMDLFTNTKTGLMAELSYQIDIATKTTSVYDKDNAYVMDKGLLVQKAGVKGTSSATNNTISEEMTRIQKTIESLQDRYDKQQDRYWKIYSNMESMMAKMNNQTQYINQIMAGITNNSNSK